MFSVLFSSMQDMEDQMHAKVIDSKDLMYTINNIFARLDPVKCGMFMPKWVLPLRLFCLVYKSIKIQPGYMDGVYNYAMHGV